MIGKTSLIGLLVASTLIGCSSTPLKTKSVPRGDVQESAVLPDQVTLVPQGEAPDGELSGAPGGPTVTMTEAERREFFRSRAPASEPVRRPPPVIIYEEDSSFFSSVTEFPFFHTLTYAGLGAIIGNQFDGDNGAGAAIGGALGFLKDASQF